MAPRGRKASPESQDERNGDRASRDTARVEGNRQELGIDEAGQGKDDPVEGKEENLEGFLKKDTQSPNNQKDSDAETNHAYEGGLVDADLPGHDRKVRLGDSDEEAKEEGHENDDPHLLALEEGFPDRLADFRHRTVAADLEKAEADANESRRNQEKDKAGKRKSRHHAR